MVSGPTRKSRAEPFRANDPPGERTSAAPDAARTHPSRTTLQARRSIVSLLLEHGQLSRTELSRLTGLNKPTMSNHVAGMLEEGLVREIGSGVSTGGRRPILLELESTRHRIAGVELDAEFVRVLITDLDGATIAETSIVLNQTEPETVIATCASAITDAAAGAPLLACGFALPGLVDRRTETVELPDPFAWNGEPFLQQLEARLGIPVFVTDRGKAAGLGEMWLLADEPLQDLVYLYLGRGIGGAIVLDRKIHWGVGSIAGEIGHMVVDPDGPPCGCGNRGCLETFAATAAIRAHARQISADFPESVLSAASLDHARVAIAAASGDRLAQQLIAHVARWVGLALVSLVNVLNPGAIVIGGPAAAWGEAFRRRVESVVEEATMLPARREAPIMLGRARERAPVLGAIALVIQHAPELLIPANRPVYAAIRTGG